jgi:hypothetical protein
MFDRTTVIIALLAIATGFATGCPDGVVSDGEGGINTNERNVENRHGGVLVGVGDIAVSERGYVAFESGDRLRIGWPDTGEVEELPVNEPTRLDFADTRDVVYVGSGLDGTLNAVDVMNKQLLWSRPLPNADIATMRVTSAPGDTRLIVSYEREMLLLDARDGEVIATKTHDRRIVDTVALPDGLRVINVLGHEWESGGPTTQLQIVDLAEGDSRTIDVPNCADKLAVTPDSRYAFMAPTTCVSDPVSVIDLELDNESFVRNLPGFGPVGVSPKGDTAVAFIDAWNVDASLFDDQSQIPAPDGDRYHMMVIDTDTLDFMVRPFGESIPRYAMTPNGRDLIVEGTDGNAGMDRPHRFDTETGELTEIDGPRMRLDNYAVSFDSKYAWALDEKLYEIDIDNADATALDPGFQPQNLSVDASSTHLFLRRSSDTICVFDIQMESCTSQLTVTARDDTM